MVLFRFEREITEEQNKLLDVLIELNQTTFNDWMWDAIESAVEADLASADSSPLAQRWNPDVKEEERA